MIKSRRVVTSGIVAGLLALGSSMAAMNAQADVEIEYWQYFFEARVTAMDTLIKNFEEANPGITVKTNQFPYADYRTKVAAAIPRRRRTGCRATVLRMVE